MLGMDLSNMSRPPLRSSPGACRMSRTESWRILRMGGREGDGARVLHQPAGA